MEIPDKMKLNKFQAVRIPDNCKYFQRYGTVHPLAQEYGGEENLPQYQSKMDSIISSEKEYQNFKD